MPSRFLLPVTMVLLAVTASTLWLTRGVMPETVETMSRLSPASGGAQANGQGKPSIGGSFLLIDQNGQEFRAEQLHGKLQLVFFGFTHCPDICPMSLSTITEALEALGAQADQITPVFITLDPERDTPEVLKAYLSNFHPSFIGLTGTEAQVRGAADAYKVYFARAPGGAGSDYSVDHSGFIYLMDRNGAYLGHFRHSDSVAKLLASLRPHL